MTADLKETVTREAEALGFDAVRITTPHAITDAGHHLMEFLEAGRHGDMTWMETTAERRRDPSNLWPDARSIIMLGMSYAPAADPLAALDEPTCGARSVYAQGKDYHDILKAKLKTLAASLADKSGAEVKVFVDTAPVMEKPLTAAAGVGWQGKHTNLVSREHGSWLFLGAVLTTAELPPDQPETDLCGSCRRYLDVCPTAAFPAPLHVGCAPLSCLPQHRTQGAHRRRIPQTHGQSHLWLRRLSCGMSVEQVRSVGTRGAVSCPR